jgi:hypothetical protein
VLVHSIVSERASVMQVWQTLLHSQSIAEGWLNLLERGAAKE